MRFINRFINSQLRFFSHTDVNVTHTIRCLDMEQSSFNLHVPSHHCCTSSPLKDWRKYHRTFTEIVDQNVDSKTPLKDEESDPNSEFDRRDKEEGHETSQIDAPERNLEEQYRQTSQTDDYDRKLQEKYKEYERRHREWDQYTDKDPNFKRYPAQPTSIDYLPPPPVRNPDQPENIEYAPPPKGYPYSAKYPKPEPGYPSYPTPPSQQNDVGDKSGNRVDYDYPPHPYLDGPGRRKRVNAILTPVPQGYPGERHHRDHRVENYRAPIRRQDTARPGGGRGYRPVTNRDYRPEELTSTFMDEFDWMKRRNMPENSDSGILLPPEQVRSSSSTTHLFALLTILVTSLLKLFSISGKADEQGLVQK